jgi:lysophospholipase L1-like esterase
MNGEISDMRENKSKKVNWYILSSLALTLLLMILFVHSTFSEANQKQQLTYLAMGDSLTAGLGASETGYLRLQAFVPRLTTHLRNEYQVHVENHGIPGITSEQLLFYIQQGPGVKDKLQEADLLTITIGGNDLLQLLRNQDLNQTIIQRTIQQFGEIIETTLSEIRHQNQKAPIYIMGLYSPYDKGHPLHDIGKQSISAYNQELTERIKQFDGVTLVSVYESFLERGTQLTHISNNDIHPNDQGYEIIYKEFKLSLSQ